ncbi:unnamed protein product [Thelazia callipaeda]|uniref:Zinc finger protein 593 homolog n=1 Tax=Thelazia callipaeda TaxID=103827 RepID=A0A0N5D5C6_THECL|nr:unnamed protein product [Thelazia callipaeda]
MPHKRRQSNKTKKRKGKDLDEIVLSMSLPKRQCLVLIQVKFDPDLPGDGRFSCLECDRHFINSKALKSHISGKSHRQQMKRLLQVPYTQRDAEEAVGLKTVSSSS